MAKVRKMSNVAVAMQSALGTKKTIEGITLAAPGVVTITTHGYSNGTYLQLFVQGMHQLNSRVFRVVNAAANTFELEDLTGGTGIDTTNYDAFSSGTVEEITFGTSITTATTMDASGGDFEFIDTTTIHNNVKSQTPGSANPIVKTFDNIWDVTDSGQIEMKKASDMQEQRAFKFTYGIGGPIELFLGYVGFTGSPTGAAQDKIVAPASITVEGVPTYYSA